MSAVLVGAEEAGAAGASVGVSAGAAVVSGVAGVSGDAVLCRYAGGAGFDYRFMEPCPGLSDG
ncbi:MAG: hypothetical protein IJL00_03375, partial [Clostridia bacterium]|nr:hypothetical protein [Clostridia bacterium]